MPTLVIYHDLPLAEAIADRCPDLTVVDADTESEIRFRIVDQTQGISVAQFLQQPLRHIEVGREVASFGHDHPAFRPQRQGGGQDLDQIDRGGIAGPD